MILSRAVRYPFQGAGWFNRILVLGLIQLIPVIGQLILLGYGLAVVRSIYAGQTDLPRLYWPLALREGAKVGLAGLLYLVPLLMAVPLLSSGSGGGNALRLPLLDVLSLVVAPIGNRLRKRTSPLAKAAGILLALLPVIVIALSIVSVLSSHMGGVAVSATSTVAQSPGGANIAVLVIALIVIFVVLIGMLVGAVRSAVENKGLFEPTRNARLLIQERGRSGTLLLNSALLIVVTLAATMLGLVLLVLPGLCMLVIGMLALWSMLAQFGIKAGIQRTAN